RAISRLTPAVRLAPWSRALGADEQRDQGARRTAGVSRLVARGTVENTTSRLPPAVRQGEQVVPAHLPHDSREPPGDLRRVLPHRPVGGPVGVALPGPQLQLPLVLAGG